MLIILKYIRFTTLFNNFVFWVLSVTYSYSAAVYARPTYYKQRIINSESLVLEEERIKKYFFLLELHEYYKKERKL